MQILYVKKLEKQICEDPSTLTKILFTCKKSFEMTG